MKKAQMNKALVYTIIAAVVIVALLMLLYMTQKGAGTEATELFRRN